MGVAKNVAAGGAVLLGGAYVASYVYEQVQRPAAKAAQNELREFKKLLAASKLDEPELLACLVRMRDMQSKSANKLELQRNIHLFVALCTGKETFKYSLDVISHAVDLIRSICRSGTDAVKVLCAAGGIRVLFVALTRLYAECMKGGPKAGDAKELVEKLLAVLDEFCTFDEKEVVLAYDIPEEACAAAQLAGIKTLGSLCRLLRPEHGFTHKRTKVLGIIASATALKEGATRLTTAHGTTSQADVNANVDLLLFFAAKSDSKSAEYARATMCIRNLIRHVPAVRTRVLSTDAGLPGLPGLSTLQNQFIELIDGGCIGCPPRTSMAPPRDHGAVSAGLDCLAYMLEGATRQLALDALVAENQRGLLALFGIMARVDSPTIRARAATEFLSQFAQMDGEVSKYINMIKSYNGVGEMAEKWGAGFRVVQELRAREAKDQDRARMQQRQQQRQAQQSQMQQQILQQMMMAEQAGASPEELEAMQQMLMGGMGGGMGGGPGGMSPEMLAMMMGGGAEQ
eukprot:TRINITY_DN27410_c0_g1_i1.p1 TRINITY_DN27410_c0_g1~~TRINITY_DN27410_c0_g1_i1.p1  ORF type:complete len:514 (+),score=245.19 TRINITY_DN27410_c0_g1_i1:64-1605(+)